mmetsp:Transcript_36263/g.92359  ORF Transcript_36263/g.92359 Transcript_36263/m.92359 type:complete len:87 (+) Transcript_36263:506-766(+)
MDIGFISHSPSHLVSAAILLTNQLLGRKEVWPSNMVHHSQHKEDDLRGCAEDMRDVLEAAPHSAFQVVRRKYQAPNKHAVADLEFV